MYIFGFVCCVFERSQMGLENILLYGNIIKTGEMLPRWKMDFTPNHMFDGTNVIFLNVWSKCKDAKIEFYELFFWIISIWRRHSCALTQTMLSVMTRGVINDQNRQTKWKQWWTILPTRQKNIAVLLLLYFFFICIFKREIKYVLKTIWIKALKLLIIINKRKFW